MNPASLINQNFLLHSYLLPSLIPGMQVQQGPALTYTDSGLTSDTFNILYVTDGALLRLEEVARAIQHYHSGNKNYCLWINQENLTDRVRQMLDTVQLQQAESEPGMYLSLEQFQGQPCAEAVQVREGEQLIQFAQIIANNWSPPDQEVLTYYQLAAEVLLKKNQHAIRLYLYYYNGKAVAALEAFPSDHSTVGLYSLATLEQYRGKGIGTRLLTHALYHLKQSGFATATLQASDDGLGIYKKLGFSEATRFFEFKPSHTV